MPVCNTTLEDSFISEEPLWGNVDFHHLGLFLSAIFGLISVIISAYLIMMHALHYLRPTEQKHIIRILVMIPVYSLVSFLSFVYYRKSIYFQVLRDCYEAFAISSFFALLCAYIAPNLHEQKEYFRTIQPKNWFLGVFWLQKCTGGENKGPFRKPRSGLTWFNVIWVGIFQYCFIRVFFTIVSVVTEVFGVYCEASNSPAFAHFWVNVIEVVSVTIAMFMVIQFYIQLKDELGDHKPFLKVLSIKLVIFFSFWQTIVISFLSSHGPLQPTAKIGYQDIAVGIPSMLLCIEMAFFAILHIFAYPWKPYSIKHNYSDRLGGAGAGFDGELPKYQGGPFGIKAIFDAMNPWDIIKASARGFRWLFVGVRRRTDDASYQPTKLSATNTGYVGPTFAGNGDAATELRPHRSDDIDLGREPLGVSAEEDDRAGLLHNSVAPARMPSPHFHHPTYAHPPANDSQGDLSIMPTHPARTAAVTAAAGSPSFAPSRYDMKPAEYEDDTDAYHPGMGPPPGTTSLSGSIHPAYRHSPPGPHAWDPLAGASSPPEDGRGSLSRPPTYRTEDPRR